MRRVVKEVTLDRFIFLVTHKSDCLVSYLTWLRARGEKMGKGVGK